jgi:predicted secreted protein
MTTTTTLTDRYVEAALRRLPIHQRPDIERELRASIADAIDDRIEVAEDPAEAELAVLTELGDPARLAAGYADRPMHLIGPAVYLDYKRLLTSLLATVVPIVAVTVGVISTIDGEPFGTILGDAVGAGVTTAVHIAVWTTVLFVVLERSPAARLAATRQWTPDTLPEPPSRRAKFGELIAETVMFVLFTAFILLSPVLAIQTDPAGEPIGVFSPWLWDTGVVYLFLALVVVMLGLSYAKYYVRWSVPLAVGTAAVEVAASSVMLWLAATDHVLNPAFIEAAGWPADAQRWINIGLIVLAGFSILHTIVDTIVRANRR